MGTTEYDDALTAQVESLAEEVRGTREVMVVENAKRDERIKTNQESIETNQKATKEAIGAARTGIGVGVAAVLVALFAVGLMFHYASQSSDRQAEIERQVLVNERDRAAARITGCIQYNEQQRTAYESEVIQSRILTRAILGAHPSADAQKAATAYLVEHDRQSAISHAERDCSPKGIEAYFAHARSSKPAVPKVERATPTT